MACRMLEPKVVLCTDLEGDLDEGMLVATRLALDRVATLVVLHVGPLSLSSGEGMLHESLDVASGRRRRALERIPPVDDRVPIERILEVGDPEQVIPRVARREGAVLLVMELRHHWFRRSLVQRIGDRVECPVVTYRARSAQTPRRTEPIASDGRALGIAERLELLEVLLDTRVSALVAWLEHLRESTRRIAESTILRETSASLWRGGGPLTRRHGNVLDLVLAEHASAVAALGLEVLTPEGATLRKYGVNAPRDAARQSLEGRARIEGVAVSLPRDADAGESQSPYVIETCARIPMGGGDHALLVATFDARRDFLRILAQPGPTPSTETYAFDDHGLMLSNSHFPEELRRMGLLPRDLALQTPRRILVRVPADRGGERSALPDEATRSHAEPEGVTLTRMAADATKGSDGRDDAGYLDYRGVLVMGVWRWIPAFGFGVAAEMDRDEGVDRSR